MATKVLLSIFFLSLAGTFSFATGQVRSALAEDTLPATKLVTHPDKDKSARSNHNVHCSLLDKRGYLWFGTTADGVYRYDGITFINYTTKNGLADNCVYSLLEDRAGNIWLGTNGGICCFDGKMFIKVPVTSATSISLPIGNTSRPDQHAPNAQGNMLQDRKGTIWFGTSDGVYCYNGRSFYHFPENDSMVNMHGLHLKNIECMLEDKNGMIWFGSGMLGGEGVCRFDGRSVTSEKPNGYTWIRSITEDKDGNIWFSARNMGAFRYNGKTFTDFTEKPPGPVLDRSDLCLSNKIGIGPVLKDRLGNIWFPAKMARFGGEGGLWRYDSKSCTNYTDKTIFENSYICSMVEDIAGNIWIGTNNTGLYRFDGKTFTCFSE